jgi:hypothetical protein
MVGIIAGSQKLFFSQKPHSLKLLIVPTINFITATIRKEWKKLIIVTTINFFLCISLINVTTIDFFLVIYLSSLIFFIICSRYKIGRWYYE